MKREALKSEPLLTFFFHDHCYSSTFLNLRATPFYPAFFFTTSILRPPTITTVSPHSSVSERMAQPSSSHHGERHHRSERERSSSHHHHRTISSTTMLLVLSLVLAVLAVMLSLPSTAGGEAGGVMGILNPKRSQTLIAREHAVAQREAEVARREAEVLAGAPGGVLPPTPSPPVVCPECSLATVTFTETVALPAQTVIKEIVKEDSLAPPNWNNVRIDDLVDRELKIAERERDISRREENVNRREHDASRRESWISDQLIRLGNETPETVEEEEVFYEPVVKRKHPKVHRELPPVVVEEYEEYAETKTIIHTQPFDAPAPANTRPAASPAPNVVSHSATANAPRTTAVEIVDETVAPPRRTLAARSPRRNPNRWLDW